MFSQVSGTDAIAGTALADAVEPYMNDIAGSADSFDASTVEAWQGVQQDTADSEAAGAEQNSEASASSLADGGESDPWLAAFFGDGQDAAGESSATAESGTTPAATPDGEADGDSPDVDVDTTNTTTTVVDGDTTVTTYTITTTVSSETGSMDGESGDDRWDIPQDWIDTASTPEQDDDSTEGEQSQGSGPASANDSDGSDSDSADNQAPANESGSRFQATSTFTVTITEAPVTLPNGATGHSTTVSLVQSSCKRTSGPLPGCQA